MLLYFFVNMDTMVHQFDVFMVCVESLNVLIQDKLIFYNKANKEDDIRVIWFYNTIRIKDT
jgi:hypothetical protein